MNIFAAVVIVAAVLAVLWVIAVSGRRMPEDGSWLMAYRYAHRGLHNGEFPENSLPAFENAAAHNVGIELDLQLSADGEVVVLHDWELERMTGVKGKPGDYTAGELKQMRLAGTEYAIPLFREVLAAVNGRVPLLVELKNAGVAGALEEKAYGLLKEYGGRYAVQSFSPFSIGWFAKHAPDVLRGQLSFDFKEGADDVAAVKRFAVRNLLVNFAGKPNFINYGKETVGRRLVRMLRGRGLAVMAWTVRNKGEEAACMRYADTVVFEDYMP